MDFGRACDEILDRIGHVLDGKQDAAQTALIVLLAEGHLLIEDVPGVGKTALARSLGATVDCSVNRIQFTPDLLPSDITGVTIFNQATRQFEFQPGAVFANIVIADEVNRASAKTQSALLEAMAEAQVSVDATTHTLAQPFMVIATQNPSEMEGTYQLPEAQRDRFMARIALGYPDRDAELAMIQHRDRKDPLADITSVVTAEQLLGMIDEARNVFVSSAVEDYVVDIVRATREHPQLLLGASPRATLQLIRATKARAAVLGRDWVLPDDVDALAVPVLSHRLIAVAGADSELIVNEIVERHEPVPAERPG